MILVDTSVWVDHLRRGNATLSTLLDRDQVMMHPFVIGELACGNLRARGEILALLERLPEAPVASHAEALRFTEARKLHGKGLGWIGIHLLAASVLAGVELWTLDRRLERLSRHTQ